MDPRYHHGFSSRPGNLIVPCTGTITILCVLIALTIAIPAASADSGTGTCGITVSDAEYQHLKDF